MSAIRVLHNEKVFLTWISNNSMGQHRPEKQILSELRNVKAYLRFCGALNIILPKTGWNVSCFCLF